MGQPKAKVSAGSGTRPAGAPAKRRRGSAEGARLETMAPVHEGAIARYLGELEQAGLKGTDIANITAVSKATVSRWRAGMAKPQPRNELILSDLYYVVGRLQEYYAPDDIRSWLYARHPQLEGQRAIDLVHEGRSVDVLGVIERLDAGVYL